MIKRAQYGELVTNPSLQLSIQPLISFVIGATTTMACILVYLSANLDSNSPSKSFLLQANLTFHHINLDLINEEKVKKMEGSNEKQANATPLRDQEQYELFQMLKNASNEDNTVILTLINEAFAAPGSLVDLFLESFREGENIEHLLNHLVIINLDPNAYYRCKSIHSHCYFLKIEGAANYTSENLFRSKGYLDIVWGRIKFQTTILELGFNFLFSDIDVLWFRDPFRHIPISPHIAISSDCFVGPPDSIGNFANGGFLYVKSCNKSLEFYKTWQENARKYPGQHDQEVFNGILKSDAFSQMMVRIQFLETIYFGGFCQLSKDLFKICTLHANCCFGLTNKIHDLQRALEDWKNYRTKSAEVQRRGMIQWRLPGKCIH